MPQCDGLRPNCSRCRSLRTDCHYEAEEGESRWSALKRRNDSLKRDRDDYRDMLALLRSRPEPEALEIFHRIRSSRDEDLLTILHQLRSTHPAMFTNMRPTSLADGSSGHNQSPAQDGQRLPPIQRMFDMSGTAYGQPQSQYGTWRTHRQSTSSVASDGSGGSYESMHSDAANQQTC